MVVLRESPGQNRPDDTLIPISRVEGTLPNGARLMETPAWFQFIGDMHIRFVFDGPTSMRSATTQDLERLRLTPEQALKFAIGNLKRVYGKPTSVAWNDVQQVKGTSPDFDSSYFLDPEFWEGVSRRHREGVVVAVPKRGGLLYAPVSDAKAVAGLRRGIAFLHSSSEQARISSALYLFKGGKWSVFQPPVS